MTTGTTTGTTTGIQLVCLDMAGTTVRDDGAVEQAFVAALEALEIPDERRPAMVDYVRETMGTSKIEVFRALFGDEEHARDANRAFETAYEAGLDGVQPIPGAAETIEALRDRGVRVALTTGFSGPTRDRLLGALGWTDIADLVVSPSDAGRGRPFPDMVLTAVLRLQVDACRRSRWPGTPLRTSPRVCAPVPRSWRASSPAPTTAPGCSGPAPRT